MEEENKPRGGIYKAHGQVEEMLLSFEPIFPS